jgi:hypothetical protein
MALTNSQIIDRACTIAKVPGYRVQAGQYLNLTLQTLCQTYDFDFIKKVQTINFTNAISYDLNADNLRTKEVYYSVNGDIFYLFQIPIETYHTLFIGPGVSNYPNKFAVDVSLSPKQLFPYPPPSISQSVTVQYFPQMPDITSPETSDAVCWFPQQEYLIMKVAACLMLETEDDRYGTFEMAAASMLTKFLDLTDDKEGYSRTIKLSRERFRNGNNQNPNKAFPLG